MAAFASRGGTPAYYEIILMWAVVLMFIGAYWMLLWRDLVRWTPSRKRNTYLTTVLAVLVGGLIGSFLAYGMRANPEAAILVGGGFVPIVWVLATVLVWRETPKERVERLIAAGTDAVCCPVCGYNMTGLRESRCPECGSMFTLDQLLTTHTRPDGEVLERD
jgi:hypothetical protein